MPENGCARILIVDDELLLRTGIRYLCDWQNEGFEIVGEAADGREGLKLTRELHPDIVITDIRMPEMDGIDLTAQIKEEFPGIQVLILSGYDDFNYVKMTFKNGASDYFLKPELSAPALLEALRKLKSPAGKRASSTEFTLLSLIAHKGGSHVQGLEALKKSGVSFSEEEPFLLLLGTGSSGEHAIAESEAEKLRGQLKKLSAGRSVTAVSGEGTIFALFQPEKDSPPAAELLRGILTQSESGFCFSLSEPFSSLSSLGELVPNLRQAREYSFYYPGEVLIVPEMARGTAPLPPSVDIAGSLEHLDIEGALSLLKEYIDRAARTRGIEPYLLKKNMQGQIYLAIQSIGRQGIPSGELNQRKLWMFRRVDDAPDYRELKEAMEYSFGLISGTVSSEREKREQDVLAPVHEYVKQHCCEELHLSDVASAVHMNYSYLSSLFRQKSNERFTDYLNRIRIERSKELLRSGNLSINDVCYAVGFLDQSYFSKVFRRYENISPSQYQRLYRRSEKQF